MSHLYIEKSRFIKTVIYINQYTVAEYVLTIKWRNFRRKRCAREHLAETRPKIAGEAFCIVLKWFAQ